MYWTVLWTVVSGVLTYVLGQLVLKLVIEPVQDFRKTVGRISHALIERANVIQNPGVPTHEVMQETSRELRVLSSELQAHLYLIPSYCITRAAFRLPKRELVLQASQALIGLSNSVYQATGRTYEANAKRVESICDSLGIFLPESSRRPK